VSDKRVLRNFVNGESVDTIDGRTTDLVDPSTGAVFGTAPLSSDKDVDRAYAAAAEALDGSHGGDNCLRNTVSNKVVVLY